MGHLHEHAKVTLHGIHPLWSIKSQRLQTYGKNCVYTEMLLRPLSKSLLCCLHCNISFLYLAIKSHILEAQNQILAPNKTSHEYQRPE